MKRLFFLALAFAPDWALGGSTMEAPASATSKLVVEQIENPKDSSYTLSYHAQGADPRTLWRKTIPNDTASPAEWCRLIAADERNGAVAALMESSQSTLRLVSIKLADGKVDDRAIPAGGLLEKLQREQGTLRVEIPDHIIYEDPEGKVSRFAVEGERLRADGNVDFEPSTLTLGQLLERKDPLPPDPQGEAKPPAGATRPPTPELAPSPAPRSRVGVPVAGGVAVVIALLVGLVVFLKRK